MTDAAFDLDLGASPARVRCPYCGERFHHGAGGVLLTARDVRSIDETAILGEERRSAARVKSRPSRLDDERRIWLPAPGDVAGRTPVNIAADFGFEFATRPRWGCPRCTHPLPASFPDRDLFVVVLLGRVGASKTATVLSIIERDYEQIEPFAATLSGGMRRPASLVPDEGVHDIMLARDPKIYELYRDRDATGRLPGTARGKHPPLEFVAQIEDRVFSTLILDVSGEDLQIANERPNVARALEWADAVVFLFDPDPHNAGSLDVTNLSTTDQAAILGGVINDLNSMGEGRRCELFIVVSKADLLPQSREVNRRVIDEGKQPQTNSVTEMLRVCNARMIADLAKRWPGGARRVHWHLLAPMPPGQKAYGVKPLVDSMLTSFVARR